MRLFGKLHCVSQLVLWNLVLLTPASVCAGAPLVDLSRATVVTASDLSKSEKKAIALLVEEVEKRTQLRWPLSVTWPGADAPVIVVGQTRALQTFADHVGTPPAADPRPEGFQIQVVSGKGAPAVCVAGADARGVLFGVGR